MGTGDNPLQSAILDHWQLVDIVAGHEFQRVQNLRVRSDDVQLLQRPHGFAHSSLVPTLAWDGANIAWGNEAHQATTVLHGKTALGGPKKVGINKLLQTHTAVHNDAVARHHLGDSHAPKRGRNIHLGVAGFGRVHEKPADEDHPQAVKAGALKKSPYPIENE